MIEIECITLPVINLSLLLTVIVYLLLTDKKQKNEHRNNHNNIGDHSSSNANPGHHQLYTNPTTKAKKQKK